MLLYDSTSALFGVVGSVLKHSIFSHAKIYQIQSILLRIEPKLRIEAPMKGGYWSILTGSSFWSMQFEKFTHQMQDGWGLATDGKVLFGSDGTSMLYKIDPQTLKGYFCIWHFIHISFVCVSVCIWYPLYSFFFSSNSLYKCYCCVISLLFMLCLIVIELILYLNLMTCFSPLM